MRVEATGWGTTDFGGRPSTRLRRVTLDVMANSVCASRLQNSNILQSHLCTFTPGRDVCQVSIKQYRGSISGFAHILA